MNSPRFINEAWESRMVYARDVYTSLWREVSRYSGVDAADRVMHTGTDERNLPYFRHAVSLADEYWGAYQSSPECIDVVPLYYGALSLGNAISFCTLSNQHVMQRTASHGLTVVPDLTRAKSVLNTKVSFGKASDTFGMVNEAFGGDVLAGRDCKLLDLLCILPELSDRLEHHTTPSTFEVTFAPIARKAGAPEGTIAIVAKIRAQDGLKINTGYVRDKLAVAAYLNSAGLRVKDEQIQWTTSRAASTEIENIAISARGSWWLLSKLSGKLIPEYMIYLAGLYVLSVYARYIPDYWLKIQDNHGDEWTLIRDFIALAEERVPKLALNHFAKASHRFELRS